MSADGHHPIYKKYRSHLYRPYSKHMGSSKKTWTLFIRRCLLKRIRADQFGDLTAELVVKSPIAGARLAELILDPASQPNNCLDPLLPVYVERLLTVSLVDASDVLAALFKGSRDHLQQLVGDGEPGQRSKLNHHNPPELEEVLLHRLAKAFVSRERPRNPIEARRTLHVMSQWMSAMVTASTSDSMMDAMTGDIPQVPPQVLLVREALAMLMVTLADNPKVVGVLDMAFPKSMYATITLFTIGSLQVLLAFQICLRRDHLIRASFILRYE